LVYLKARSDGWDFYHRKLSKALNLMEVALIQRFETAQVTVRKSF
jgi:hypothetical protein